MGLLLLLSPLALSTAPSSTATTYVAGGSFYTIHVRSSTGTLQAVLTDYLWFTYSKRVNEVGLLQFALTDKDGVLRGAAVDIGCYEYV
jgi:hypothetical protein